MIEFKTDIDVLLECVKCQQDNSQTLCQSLMTLSNVINDGKTKDYFRECGGLKYVYNVLLRTNKNEVKIATLFCLASAVEKSVFSQNLLTQQSVFSVIHSILQIPQTTSSKLHQAAIYFLLCLVADNSQAQNQARETGCLADLMDKLRSYVSNINCVEEYSRELSLATSALSVCVNNPQNDENQRLCSPLLPHIFNVVRQIATSEILSPLLSFVGLVVANNVFNQDRVRKCGGLNVLISCLCSLTKKQGEESLTTAVQVVGSLDYCLTENVSSIGLFREVCGAGPLFSLLSPGLLSQQEQVQVVIALSHVLTTNPDEVCPLAADHYQILVGLLTQADDEELIKALKYVLHMCKSSDDQLQVEELDKKIDKSNLRQSNEMILCKIDELAAKLDTFQEESRQSISPMDQNNSCSVPVNESFTDIQNETQSIQGNKFGVRNKERGELLEEVQPTKDNSFANVSEEAPILMNWLKQLIPQFLRRESSNTPPMPHSDSSRVYQPYAFDHSRNYDNITSLRTNHELQSDSKRDFQPYYLSRKFDDISLLRPNRELQSDSIRDFQAYDHARNFDNISSPRSTHEYLRMNNQMMPHYQNNMPVSNSWLRTRNHQPESYQMGSFQQVPAQPQGGRPHPQNSVPASPLPVFDYKHGHRIEEKAYRINCADDHLVQKDCLDNTSFQNHQRHAHHCQTVSDDIGYCLQSRNCSSQSITSQFQTEAKEVETSGERLSNPDSSCSKCGNNSANTSDGNISMFECNRNNNNCVNKCTSEIIEIVNGETEAIHEHEEKSLSVKVKSKGSTIAVPQMPVQQCEKITTVKRKPSVKRTLSTEQRRQNISAVKSGQAMIKAVPQEQTPEPSQPVSHIFKTPAAPSDGSFLRPTDVSIRRRIRTPSSCGSSASSVGSRHNVRVLARKSVIGIQPFPISSPPPHRIACTPTTPLPSPACSEFDFSLLKSAGRRETARIYGLLTPSIKRQEPGYSRCWTDVRTLKPKYSKAGSVSGRSQTISDTDSQFSPTTSDEFTSSQEGAEEETPNDSMKRPGLCPGCYAPDTSNRPLLNSRTYNIALETSTGTCKQHRSLRCIERHLMLKHKSNQSINKSRPLPELNNRKVGTSCPPSRGLSVYEFYTSSGSPEQVTKRCVSPPCASTYLNKNNNGHVWTRKHRKRSRAVYSEEEIKNLLHGVEMFGTKWSQILVTYSFHPSRTAVDLKEKHARLMKKDKVSKKKKKRGPLFSMCEERRLRRGVRTLGYNWRGILHMFQFAKGRTAEELRLKWRTMNKKCAVTEYM